MSDHTWTPQEDAKIVTMLARSFSRLALARTLKVEPQEIGNRLQYLIKTGAVHWAKNHQRPRRPRNRTRRTRWDKS